MERGAAREPTTAIFSTFSSFVSSSAAKAWVLTSAPDSAIEMAKLNELTPNFLFFIIIHSLNCLLSLFFMFVSVGCSGIHP
ncbi:hypothetical protein LZP73_04235 [Shewanella sp. AS16]|uniref:hypothetical protein n=1 Tax=Shewanella sp. AS16 TaxID=2907625 RepID=UPI001F437D1D|nr:hypothetical protein [Shewanella sp. AS16]MCE9685426.1 hypothetical protein [Shewanella sp. AS16]